MAIGLLCTLSLTPALADPGSPVGIWRTFDIESGTPKNLVQITEENGVLSGQIIELLDASENSCSKCKGDLADQPLKGLTILSGLDRQGDQWSGGTILRPTTGAEAKASLKLIDGGSRLEVTGTRGLMSRTQIWERAIND